MHYHRKTFFFWLGVVIFPVFWAWFTLGRKFPKWQRYAAFGWMTVVLAAFAITWPQMSGQYYLMTLGLPIILFYLSLWLTAWLVFRAMKPSCFDMIIWYFFLGGAFGGLVPGIHEYLRRLPSEDFTFSYALAPLIPALLHLMLEPMQRWIALMEARYEEDADFQNLT